MLDVIEDYELWKNEGRESKRLRDEQVQLQLQQGMAPTPPPGASPGEIARYKEIVEQYRFRLEREEKAKEREERATVNEMR